MTIIKGLLCLRGEWTLAILYILKGSMIQKRLTVLCDSVYKINVAGFFLIFILLEIGTLVSIYLII